ncbi:MAG: polysaccharide biosynthesis protein, partial [Elusimicrobia bacterium]|nr:polysaccharide biosynthesis protein [Elusimicrobiota bacterium]
MILRRTIVVGCHFAAIIISNYLAFYLRFDGDIPLQQINLWVSWVPLLFFLRAIFFIPFRLYKGIWKYPSVHDLVNIIIATASSTFVFFLAVRILLGTAVYPRSIFIIDTLLLVIFLSGIRLAKKVYRRILNRKGDNRLIIYGAGDAGEMVVRDIQNNPASPYDPIGFIDDNRVKVGSYIRGVRVLGTRFNIDEIMERYKPEEALIAIPSASSAELRSIVGFFQHHRVVIRILPSLAEILQGKFSLNQARSLSMEDLLSRKPVFSGSNGNTSKGLRGKTVMVTGAGGSIGSELCRQIASAVPRELLMLDRYENGLYETSLRLAGGFPGISCKAIIGDITDIRRLETIFARNTPQIIFHAAAHKHVPLMEENPIEAVKNNIFGTKNIAELASRFGVEKFVLISTDKAVRPASIMGMTKRIAELYVAGINGSSRTQFLTVRFGNVLGSNSSVVPMFTEQIKRGGPVTVTHPDVKRY